MNNHSNPDGIVSGSVGSSGIPGSSGALRSPGVLGSSGSSGSPAATGSKRPDVHATRPERRYHWLRVWGPGLIVMLADTDAGCLITAAQSGAQFGYAMVLPQLMLIPILFMVQEMTVRLGIVTGKGHGALIREHFGLGWAIVSAGTLMLSVVGALLTEFIGIAGVGELFGVSKWVTIPLATVLLIGIAFSGSYRRVEKIGVALGLFELTFVIAMVMARPTMQDLLRGLGTVPVGNSAYVYLVAANVGAVIMPWMIFYQQGAVIDKGLGVNDLGRERRDTAIGAVVTQGIMIVSVVATAAAVARTGAHPQLDTVADIVHIFVPVIGSWQAKTFIGAAMLGGAFVAALVVALAGTWGVTEVLGWKHSLNERLDRHNVGFYTMYALAHVIGAILVLTNFNLIDLAVDVQVMNAMLLPIVLGFLLLLEAKLPKRYRMRGVYKWVVTALCLIIMVFGLYMIGPLVGIW